jgi:acyl carrier protein
VNNEHVYDLMKAILHRQGKDVSKVHEEATLRSIGFRSLDFSELCLKIELELGKELNFEGSTLRSIETVKDVFNFIQAASL